ncbi:MAG TPA: SUMF1/EgtB/PvdO family nonheme iron enzyme [Candidatus Sulfotelmatobacter sp.]|nr:SUMF1/EgtB/PvdO family nonheme iron enzyme [Candidatus Sulfotelmatobacter sp.]
MITVQNHVAAELLARMAEAREASDALFRIVRPDSLYCRPIPERHRIIFYIGHLEAFDWNLLHESPLNLKTQNADFDRLFAFGIDPVGTGLPDDQPSDWPALEAVRDYVAQVRATLDGKLPDAIDANIPGRDGFSLATLLNVAVEHRLMHVETLAYMLHQLPLAAKVPQPDRACSALSAFVPRMIEIPSGIAHLGLRRDSEEFGWDNEFVAHAVNVPAFEIDRYKVTNGQFLEFMAAGGYERRELWSEDAWNWRNTSGISSPVFWKKIGEQWFYQTMFEEIRLPVDWPVYVSQAEASAYANWAGKSLPTEAEWHRAAYSGPDGGERRYPWGDESPAPERGNFDLQRWNPAPVNAFPSGKSAFGVEDMIGNGWEWTSTAFAPFPGFMPFPFYPGYSANFFDGKHFVMKGGSPRTAACMTRPTFRNWFQAHYQYVYAGFRCVRR